MAGKQKGQFLVSESNGSKVSGQIPSLRVRLADSGLVVAVVKSGRSNLCTYIRNNPMSVERKELETQLVGQGYTRKDLEIILAK